MGRVRTANFYEGDSVVSALDMPFDWTPGQMGASRREALLATELAVQQDRAYDLAGQAVSARQAAGRASVGLVELSSAVRRAETARELHAATAELLALTNGKADDMPATIDLSNGPPDSVSALVDAFRSRYGAF